MSEIKTCKKCKNGERKLYSSEWICAVGCDITQCATCDKFDHVPVCAYADSACVFDEEVQRIKVRVYADDTVEVMDRKGDLMAAVNVGKSKVHIAFIVSQNFDISLSSEEVALISKAEDVALVSKAEENAGEGVEEFSDSDGVTFEKWCAVSRIVLKPWQAEAAKRFLAVVKDHQEFGSGKTFIATKLLEFLNQFGNSFVLDK